MNRGERQAVAPKNMSREEARFRAETSIDSIREALLILDNSLRTVSANRIFYGLLKATAEDIEGYPIFEIGNRQWKFQQGRRLLKLLQPRGATRTHVEIRHRFEHIGGTEVRLRIV
ncbi:MAG: hypothetical protein GF344_20145 [Chitinivibrionales bacterium]|nr:hypothetical protein [Chitinivibrionales bacterium]MBD3358926.1 hypothetical protein [Chitinivibrionales bacterium]